MQNWTNIHVLLINSCTVIVGFKVGIIIETNSNSKEKLTPLRSIHHSFTCTCILQCLTSIYVSLCPLHQTSICFGLFLERVLECYEWRTFHWHAWPWAVVTLKGVNLFWWSLFWCMKDPNTHDKLLFFSHRTRATATGSALPRHSISSVLINNNVQVTLKAVYAYGPFGHKIARYSNILLQAL